MTLHCDPHAQLLTALMHFIGRKPDESRWTPWHSATFSGARHAFQFGNNGQTQMELTRLEHHEFAIAGHIIADVSIGKNGLVEILSVAEN